MAGNTREAVRNQLLLDALSGPVDLNAVDWHVLLARSVEQKGIDGYRPQST